MAHLFLIVLLNHAKPHQPLLMMGLTVTSTAPMGETLVGLQALVLAHHAMLASAVQTARQPILAKLHLHLLTVGLMVTFTASMEEILRESQGHASALPATLALVVQTVLPALQAIVDHLLMFALLILVKPHQTLLTMGLTVTSTASMGGTLAGLLAPAPALATPGMMVLIVKTILKVP